jgi:transposase InsO family protein
VAAWIEEYNHEHKHSALGMRTPIAYEIALQNGELDTPEAAA